MIDSLFNYSLGKNMKIKKISLALFVQFLFIGSSYAAPSINDMQSCQGVIDFINQKIDFSSSKYSKKDVEVVHKGLNQYSDYLQTEVINPGLLKHNGGDVKKSNDTQKMITTYRGSIVEELNGKYPTKRLYMDHIVMVNNCVKMVAPSGATLDNLKTAFNTMIQLSKIE